MQTRPLVITAIIVLTVLGGAVALSAGDTATVHTPSGSITVAVADTPEERRQGLMHRETVPHDGMLFVYSDAAPRTFWMKNTQIPLDIVFIGPNGTVLNVAAADPEPGTPPSNLTRYRSDGAAQHVIEVPQGQADDMGLTEGATVQVARR
ncbi:MAG: DUF192 domain-containing protein [Candidatus Nanohaloarchaea archaeon]